jgi:hypothetical protein
MSSIFEKNFFMRYFSLSQCHSEQRLFVASKASNPKPRADMSFLSLQKPIPFPFLKMQPDSVRRL